MGHGFQHLCCRDHNPSPHVGCHDDPLLQNRHFFGPQLDTEVAAGDHHAVGLLEDGLQARHCLLTFDLRDDRHVAAAFGDQRLGSNNVLRSPDEGERDVVHALGHTEAEILPILVGQCGLTDRRPWQIDPLLGIDAGPRNHCALHHIIHHAGGDELNQPVINQNTGAGAYILCKPGIRDGNICGVDAGSRTGRSVFRAQPDALVWRHFDPFHTHLSDANPWPLQILNDGDWDTAMPRRLPDRLHRSGMRFAGAMRKIQPSGIHPAVQQLIQYLRGSTGGPDRTDDLDFSHPSSVRGYSPGKGPSPARQALGTQPGNRRQGSWGVVFPFLLL